MVEIPLESITCLKSEVKCARLNICKYGILIEIWNFEKVKENDL